MDARLFNINHMILLCLWAQKTNLVFRERSGRNVIGRLHGIEKFRVPLMSF